LLDLSMEEFTQFSTLFGNDIYDVLQPEQVVNARNVYGGTASGQVSQAISRAEESVQEVNQWFASYLVKSK
jgi:argininosuccinate lyase